MKGFIVETEWDGRDPDESEIIYNRQDADELYDSIDLEQIYNTEKMTAGKAFKGEMIWKRMWAVTIYEDDYIEYFGPVRSDVY